MKEERKGKMNKINEEQPGAMRNVATVMFMEVGTGEIVPFLQTTDDSVRKMLNDINDRKKLDAALSVIAGSIDKHLNDSEGMKA